MKNSEYTIGKLICTATGKPNLLNFVNSIFKISNNWILLKNLKKRDNIKKIKLFMRNFGKK